MKPDTDFEAELAKTLGLGKQKTSAISQLSIEELEELLQGPVQAATRPLEAEKSKSKTASISLEMADKWGRELAHKTASIAESAGNLAQKVIKSPAAHRMAGGAAVGAATDLATNRDSSLKSVAGGAAIGTLGGIYAPRAAKALAGHDSEIGKNFAKGLAAKK